MRRLWTPEIFGNSGGGGSRFRAAALALGPVAYYRLGDVGNPTLDEMGLYNGTYVGGVTNNVPGLLVGDANTAMTVDGINGHVSVPFNVAFGPAAFSIHALINFNVIAGGWRPIACRDTYNAGTGWMFFFQPAANLIIFCHSSGEAGDCQALWGPVAGTTYSMVATWDGVNGRIYIDGVLHAGPAAVPILPIVQDFYIGARHNNDGTPGPADEFDGTLDEVVFYNYALTLANVQTLHNAAI